MKEGIRSIRDTLEKKTDGTTPGTGGIIPKGNGEGRSLSITTGQGVCRSMISTIHVGEFQECFPAQQRAQVNLWEFCGICNHYKEPACPCNSSQGFFKLGREFWVFKWFIFQKKMRI